ncbi:VOC family protein [Pararhizobium gei]|uniref:VOC family protein n=1 Tax=Pararhizobium gei TaxID=1395951 RepID=UPI0023DBBF2F|nr:VOC family protein [Rhizobium gei]
MKADYILLAVDNPAESANFYQLVFGATPLELSPGFALFEMNETTKLGLWARKNIEPKVIVDAGGSEIAISVEGRESVDSLHSEWIRKGVTILQEPVAMDFGYTFTGSDPDGHRLRVFTPDGI